MSKRLQIYILSCDRLDYCCEAVQSALMQSLKGIEVIVSDNSSGPAVVDALEKRFPDLTIVRRRPQLPALEHFNQIIAESEAEFLVLFHDDDVLDPDYAKSLIAHLEADSELVAVGTNANILAGEMPTKRLFMGQTVADRRLSSVHQLIKPYTSLDLDSPAPFPGYMYRTQSVKGLALDPTTGGKHADVSFLMSVLGRGPILWLAQPRFLYRFHGNNDSRAENIASRMRWLRFVKSRYPGALAQENLQDFRFQLWSRWLVQHSTKFELLSPQSIGWRRDVARRFILTYGTKLAATRPAFWRRVLRSLRARYQAKAGNKPD